jgi:hypothetical protein
MRAGVDGPPESPPLEKYKAMLPLYVCMLIPLPLFALLVFATNDFSKQTPDDGPVVSACVCCGRVIELENVFTGAWVDPGAFMRVENN